MCHTKKKQQNFFIKLWYKTKNVLQKRLKNCSTTILRILCKPSAQYLSNSFFRHSFDRIKKISKKMCQLYSLMCQKNMIHEQKNRNEHINRRKLLNKLVAACLQSSAQFFMLCICYRCHKIWLIFLVKYFFVVSVFVISSLVRMLYMVRTVISPNTNSPLI